MSTPSWARVAGILIAIAAAIGAAMVVLYAWLMMTAPRL